MPSASEEVSHDQSIQNTSLAVCDLPGDKNDESLKSLKKRSASDIHGHLSNLYSRDTDLQGNALSQKPEDHVIDNEATPSQEDGSAQRGSGDLEAVHPVPSGPLYSVFTERQRQYIVFMVAAGGFFSPLSANIYFPALNSLSRELKVSNEMINLSLTTYMICQGLAPTVFGDLADMTGRRPVYMLGFIIYIGANVGLALQNNYAALLILRCLQSTGSSGTVALGNGVVADIASSGERGKFMGMLDPSQSRSGMLTKHRYCSIWTDGSSCYSACPRRHSDSILGLEMAFLVFDNPGGRFSHTLGYHISRNWAQCGGQWFHTASRLEYVPPQVFGDAEN